MSAVADTVHTEEVLVATLPTKSVTLARERATVVREIQDITIHPGPNEIKIYGLDPVVDVNSIRVDGFGAATITDIQTEIVDRKRTFEELFGDDESQELEDEDEDADDDDDAVNASDDPDETYGVDDTKVKAARGALREARNALEQARSEQSAALSALGFLDGYGKSMHAKDVEVTKVDDFLKLYREQRAVENDRYRRSTEQVAKGEEDVEALTRRLKRVKRTFTRAKNAASKEARRRRQRRKYELDQRRQERRREKLNQKMFVPHNVAQVTVHLDAHSMMTPTPGSSRRSSLNLDKPRVPSSSTTTDEGTAAAADKVNLRLTYVVPKATWSSRYELSINTPSASAHIVYRAVFQNYSAETWTNARVTLSTSQTSFSSLDERIPTLQPWMVKVGYGGMQGDAAWRSGLRSSEEMDALKAKKKAKALAAKDGAQISQMLPNQQPAQQLHQYHQQAQTAFGQHQTVAPGAPTIYFGAAPAAPPPPPLPPVAVTRGGLFGGRVMRQGPLASMAPRNVAMREEVQEEVSEDDEPDEEDTEDDDGDSQTLNYAGNLLGHQDSIHQAYGLTTTYDLPGQRTLAPSKIARRHVLAKLDFTSVTLSHVLVPKLRSAAFLKARIKNSSNVTLLPGEAGMTVDGTFLGSTRFPACAPQDSFNLSLGVDPSILVTYGKPTVRRATSGIISKEDSAVFTRSCWIKNTRGTAVSITVLDQVPVSEDEKLRVGILDPRGLQKEGDVVRMATATWGKGTVRLGKQGEMKWELTLEKGKEVKLTLQYETRLPAGSQIVGMN